MRKHPMKVNVYHFARTTTSALAPLFPYVDPGAIVPCVSSFRGGAGRSFGAFQHFNTVDEIMINFGSHGAAPRPGMVATGAALHQVSIRMTDPNDDAACQISVVTQRQAEAGTPQHEVVTFFCTSCQAPLTQREYPSHPDEPTRLKYAAGDYEALETVIETAYAAADYNAGDDTRNCKKCGHVNEPFPLSLWGWERYVEQSLTAADAHRTFIAAHAAAKAPV